jgi:hypothetical protein
MVTLRRPNVATSQSLLQLTKGQINYYLEKAKCGHSTKCAPGNDGHTAGQVPGQAKERFTGSRQQDAWLLQRVKNLSFVGSGILHNAGHISLNGELYGGANFESN